MIAENCEFIRNSDELNSFFCFGKEFSFVDYCKDLKYGMAYVPVVYMVYDNFNLVVPSNSKFRTMEQTTRLNPNKFKYVGITHSPKERLYQHIRNGKFNKKFDSVYIHICKSYKEAIQLEDDLLRTRYFSLNKTRGSGTGVAVWNCRYCLNLV